MGRGQSPSAGGEVRSTQFPRSALVEIFSAGTIELRRSLLTVEAPRFRAAARPFERAFRSLPAERGG